MLLLWATDERLGTVLFSSAALFSLIYVSLFFYKGQNILSKAQTSSELWSALCSPLKLLKSRVMAWIFLIRGPQIIQAAYKKSNGSPFSVDVPENRYWIVSKWDHIREIDAAPEGVLSLQGAAKEILQPRHTMEEFNWNDKKGSDGAPLLKTLRTMLTGHLPELLPDIRDMMSALLEQHRDRGRALNGDMVAPLYPMVIGSIAQSNAFAFFGRDLAHDEIFMKAGMDMIEQTLIIAEIVRVLPSFMANPTGKFLSNYMNSSKIVFNTLEPLVTHRFEERERAKRGHDVPEHKDCVQWVMENSPKTKPWSVKRVVHELIALWFGSVHITSTTACFVLFDLCSHPEYIEPLRQEFEATGWEAFQKSGGKLLPLMDSFMKESARLTPVESVSTRRKALKPFHFSDGTRVEAGEWVCSAPRSMNVDSTHYSDPTQFHGFRFVRPEVLDKASKTFSGAFKIPEGQEPSDFTELSDWQLWGTGKSSCTGRWYASSAIKTMLALFITKWDISLEDPTASRYFAWRTFIYPYSNVKAVLKERTA